MANALAIQSRDWLLREALPFWLSHGIDPRSQGIVEGISLEGQVLPLSRRVMIQGRQLYVFRVAHEMGYRAHDLPERMRAVVAQLLREYSLPSGAFAHSVKPNGAVDQALPDLYGQAFVLFGLANAHKILRDPEIKKRAEALLSYLRRERTHPAGGFTELLPEGTFFRSNPHMHLFEAGLAWWEVDGGGEWCTLARELATLAKTKFIDKETGMLAEHFTPAWDPLRENGHFLGEPGHFFEWSWLFSWYGALAASDTTAVARGLFTVAERHGVCPKRGVVYDEIWSDGTTKKASSRYWPQCERVKAALRLGEMGIADDAMQTLLRYLDTPVKGLCFDHQRTDGTFAPEAPRASFLYHVANAIAEYGSVRN